MNRQQFLKHTHALFSYFTSLVDAYAKVLQPTDVQRNNAKSGKTRQVYSTQFTYHVYVHACALRVRHYTQLYSYLVFYSQAVNCLFLYTVSASTACLTKGYLCGAAQCSCDACYAGTTRKSSTQMGI
jgi:hypothetical protein